MVFIDNKYTKLYFAIVEKSQCEQRVKGERYYERHHIIPKCLGGNNAADNLVLLTAREHWICHYLLCKMNNNPRLIFALNRMSQSNGSSHQRYNSRLYQYTRERFAQVIGEFHKERFRDPAIKNAFIETMSRREYSHSDETKRKIGNANKGNPSPRKGTRLSDQTKQRMSAAQQGKIITEETRKKISEKLRSKPFKARGPMSEKHKLSLANAKKGAPGNNRRWWKIIDPKGNETVTRDRKEYCFET